MPRTHHMDFGAEPGFQGTRFRLWAPDAEAVDLCLDQPRPSPDGNRVPGDQRMVPMGAHGDGWFEVLVPEAREGSLYRFRPRGGTAGDGGLQVPDPASRFQPKGVHGPSEVIDPDAYSWNDRGWRGRPWEETVLYELHVGTFSPEGTYQGVIDRLDHLVELGVTAIELMPVASCPGAWNWGYDGVALFAPHCSYGRPEDLKRLIDIAHQKGLMVFLDVVYNHFGPEGNYLHVYAKTFFDESRHTPWGAAINFERDGSRTVRDFFIHNALYWIEEFHFDGLRLDAVHAIERDAQPDVLQEIAAAVAHGPGRNRHVHLVLENDANEARYLERNGSDRPRHYVAQWNDDIHHCLHTLATGESGGYYGDYADLGAELLARCLADGFAYQGDASAHRGGERRGEPSAHLPPTAFVAFDQNHDQIGNRALGDRLTTIAPTRAVEALLTLLLLNPQPPMLFMGEEWGAKTPFLFFADFGPDLADAVREGRRGEFASFPEFSDPAARERIPDPLSEDTFRASRLDWSDLEAPEHADRLARVRDLLRLRREELVPRLRGLTENRSEALVVAPRTVQATWTLVDGARLCVLANLGDTAQGGLDRPPGRILASNAGDAWTDDGGRLAAWSTVWFLEA